MAMTRLEAEERAHRIWGDQVSAVVPRGRWAPGEWTVRLHLSGRRCSQQTLRVHELDGNGHATCHQACADAEWQVCV